MERCSTLPRVPLASKKFLRLCFWYQLPRLMGCWRLPSHLSASHEAAGGHGGKRETVTCLLQESGRLVLLLPLWLVAKAAWRRKSPRLIWLRPGRGGPLREMPALLVAGHPRFSDRRVRTHQGRDRVSVKAVTILKNAEGVREFLSRLIPDGCLGPAESTTILILFGVWTGRNRPTCGVQIVCVIVQLSSLPRARGTNLAFSETSCRSTFLDIGSQERLCLQGSRRVFSARTSIQRTASTLSPATLARSRSCFASGGLSASLAFSNSCRSQYKRSTARCPGNGKSG